MKYNKNILEIITMINEVLCSLEKEPLFKNQDFQIHKEVSFSDWIKISLKREGSVQIIFEIFSSGLRIDIDRIEEALDISYSDLIKERERVKNYIFMLFTTSIKVKYCGKGYTKVYFISKEGNVIDSMEYYRNILFSFKINCKEIVYKPMYESTSYFSSSHVARGSP